MQFFVSASRRLGAIYAPAFLGILVGGLFLASQLGSRAAWIPLALCATLLMILGGALGTGRTMSRLKKAVSQEAAAFASISALARSKALVLSYGFRVGLAVGIVFLMTATPGFIPSTTALVTASLVGVLLASRVRRRSEHFQGGCGWRQTPGPTAAQRT